MKRCGRCGEVLLQFERFYSIIITAVSDEAGSRVDNPTMKTSRRHLDEETIIIGLSCGILGFGR